MDRRERYIDPEEQLRIAMENQQSRMWTAMPGYVVSFDPVNMTCQVQVALTTTLPQENGASVVKPIPVLLDCPVCFPGGGGVTLTFPLVAGDECLVVFASRCIDAWWQQSGLQPQAEFRMHDLSDGFVIPGVKSQPNKFTVSTTAAQLRSNDGQTAISINPTVHVIDVRTSGDLYAEVTGNVTATIQGQLSASVTGNASVSSSGTITLQAPTINLTGNVNVSGGLTVGGTTVSTGSISTSGNVTAGGIDLKTHVHTGVTGGSSNTGGPTG